MRILPTGKDKEERHSMNQRRSLRLLYTEKSQKAHSKSNILNLSNKYDSLRSRLNVYGAINSTSKSRKYQCKRNFAMDIMTISYCTLLHHMTANNYTIL